LIAVRILLRTQMLAGALVIGNDPFFKSRSEQALSHERPPRDAHAHIAQGRPRWHNQTVLERRIAMPLQRGKVLGYDFNRMVVDFTMFNQGKTVRCAISTAAMDDLEGKHEVKADQRVDQFLRLRDAIEERASGKFSERPAHAEGPVVLRSNDFFK
jgi:hypothetical protein